jgi:hypothetical protein
VARLALPAVPGLVVWAVGVVAWVCCLVATLALLAAGKMADEQKRHARYGWDTWGDG